MPGTVYVDIEHSPDGELFEIPGLGQVPNRGSKEVDDVQIALYKAQGFDWPESNELRIVVDTNPPAPEEEPEDVMLTQGHDTNELVTPPPDADATTTAPAPDGGAQQ